MLVVLAASGCAGGPEPDAPPPPISSAHRALSDAPPRPGSPSAAGEPRSFGAIEAVRLPLPLPPRGDGSADAEIWSVDGVALTKSDLGDFVLRYLPDRAAEALDQLVDEVVIEAEAVRESVTVDDAYVRLRTEAYIDARRRDARVQFGAKTEFEALLAERYGRTIEAYRADAQRLVRALCLRDRLVRLDQMREDGVEVRVLVLWAQDDARAAVKSLRDGADMMLLAEHAGARRPSSPPPAARGEIPEKDLEAKLFAAAPGDVLDPVPFEAPGEGGISVRNWQVFKVTRAWKGSSQPWPDIAGRVEASIAVTPVTEDEYLRWRRRALARHRVEARDAGKGFLRTKGGR